MKSANPRAGAAVGLIVILLAGCDNVSWGGADLAIVPPPPKARSTTPAATVEARVEALPTKPILYYVSRNQSGAFMTPVGEVQGDSLAPIRATGDAQTYAGRFIAEFMREGAEFTLFSRGVRAGTFIVHDASLPAQPQCPLLPTASGALELSSGVTATEFLAIARADAPAVPRRVSPPETTGRMRSIVGPILAERIMRARQAELPASWERANAQVIAFPAATSADDAFAATFLVGDQLGPGDDNVGHSVFFIAAPNTSQTGYDTVFVSFRNYSETGKAAPRVIDFLDWNRDESSELLLQVYGVNDTWFEAIGRSRAEGWRRIFRDRCEDGGRSLILPPPAPPDTAAADTAENGSG
jgi:hypothetical protein